jgi:hypothetical protein
MKEIKLKKLSFKSYLKLSMINGLGTGLLFGLLGFIISIFDKEAVYVTFGETTTTGINAGISFLIVLPIMMLIMFMIFSLFSYSGFSIIMKFKKSIKLQIQELE